MTNQLQLPVADAELIRTIELEMRQCSTSEPDTLSASRFRCGIVAHEARVYMHHTIIRYAWALVHAQDDHQVKRGLKLVTSMLKDKDGDVRDLEYLMAVAQYKLGRCIEARKTLNAILEVRTTHKQTTPAYNSVHSCRQISIKRRHSRGKWSRKLCGMGWSAWELVLPR